MLGGMTAAPVPAPDQESGRPPFEDATPARVRAALTPEDVEEFDRQWRAAMAAATESLDLSEVQRTLESWRRVAWLTTARGHEGYRALLAEAERRTRTGERAPGAVSLERVKAMIAERLG
jgi:hypothetical protein